MQVSVVQKFIVNWKQLLQNQKRNGQGLSKK